MGDRVRASGGAGRGRDVVRAERRRRLTGLVALVVASAATLATSMPHTDVEAEAQGEFALPAGVAVVERRVEISLNAAGAGSGGEDGPVRWDAHLGVQVSSEPGSASRAVPTVTVTVLSDEPGTPEAGTPTGLLSGPPCPDGRGCDRRYRLAFRRVGPTTEALRVRWRLRASVDYDTWDEPPGTRFTMVVEPRLPRETGPPGGMLSTELELSRDDGPSPAHVRFLRARPPDPRAAAASTGAALVRTWAWVGHETDPLTLVVRPQDGSGDAMRLTGGRTAVLEPFGACTPDADCVRGYELWIEGAVSRYRQRALQVEITPLDPAVEVAFGGARLSAPDDAGRLATALDPLPLSGATRVTEHRLRVGVDAAPWLDQAGSWGRLDARLDLALVAADGAMARLRAWECCSKPRRGDPLAESRLTTTDPNASVTVPAPLWCDGAGCVLELDVVVELERGRAALLEWSVEVAPPLTAPAPEPAATEGARL